ncbi:hypothetical protein CSKR_103597 [Clonorchis sinensis]|uniref:Uncharacterized protein n=1 Tax=Clonorchis sinensis TaxID=79923 RepID=A0A419PTY2_CLOSI|nr:hypothetical protein CSKR_103597 [Clonorchis sinensis]
MTEDTSNSGVYKSHLTINGFMSNVITNGDFLENNTGADHTEHETSFTKTSKPMSQGAQSRNGGSPRQKLKELRDSVFSSASTRGGHANCTIQSLVNLFACGPRKQSTTPTRSCTEIDNKSYVGLRNSTDGTKEKTSLNGQQMQENYSTLPKLQSSIKFTPMIELPSALPLGTIPLRASDSVKLHRQTIHLTLSGETRTTRAKHSEEKESCSVTEKMEELNDSRRIDGFDRSEDTSQMTLETITSSRPASVPFTNTSEFESISDSREQTPTPKLRTRKMKSRSFSENMKELCSQDLGPSHRPKTASATLCVGLQILQKSSRESSDSLKVLTVKKDASRSCDSVSRTGQSFPRPPETHHSIKPSRKHLDDFNKVTLETRSIVPMPFRTTSHNQEEVRSKIVDTSKSNFVLTADASKSMGADEVRITPKPPTPIRSPRPRILTIRNKGHDSKRECSLDAHLRRLRSENCDFLPSEPLILDRRKKPPNVHNGLRNQTENYDSAENAYTYPGPKYKCYTALVLDEPKVIRQRSTRSLATWDAVTQQGDTMVNGQIPIPDDLSAPPSSPALVWTQKVARKSGQVSFDLSNNLCYEYECSDVPKAQGERIIGYVSSTGDAPGEGISQTLKGRKCLRLRREREAVWHAENPYYDGISTKNRKPRHSVPYHEQNRPTLLIGYSSNLYPSRFASQMPVVNESPARILRFEPRSQLSGQENSPMVVQSEKPGWKKREYHHSSSPTLPTSDISSCRPFGFCHDLKFYKGATFERSKCQNRRPIFQIMRAGSDQPTT